MSPLTTPKGTNLTITVYTKPNCQPCRATKRWLDNRGVEYSTVDVTTSPADLEAIKEWSYEFHPDTTERFINALLNHVDLLESFPRIGTPVRNYPGVRLLVHTPVRIFYRVRQDQRRVEIPACVASCSLRTTAVEMTLCKD